MEVNNFSSVRLFQTLLEQRQTDTHTQNTYALIEPHVFNVGIQIPA